MSNIEFPFFAFPQAFIYSEDLRRLPPNAKLLYMLLLDRTQLSEKNKDKFSDEKGAFVYFSLDEISLFLNCGISTAEKMVRSLEKNSLAEISRQGRNLPNKIRVLVPEEIFTKPTYKNDESGIYQNKQSGLIGMSNPDLSESAPNHTYNNNTYNSNTYPHQGDEELTRMFKEQVEYDVIACGENRALLDGLIMIMCEMYICTDKDILIGGKHYPADYVRKRLRRINSESIMDVYYRIAGNRAKVKEASGYVKKLLFEAPAAGIISASLDYGHDFNQ